MDKIPTFGTTPEDEQPHGPDLEERHFTVIEDALEDIILTHLGRVVDQRDIAESGPIDFKVGTLLELQEIAEDLKDAAETLLEVRSVRLRWSERSPHA